MRSIGTKVAITAAGLLLFSQLAQASDVEAELRQMQERIAELESQLGNETDSLLEEEASGSFLSSIIEDTDMEGWVAASYNYNFEGQHNGATAAANNTFSHPATNTFQLDQVQISIDNAATEDSRGGAHIDFEAGNVNQRGGGVAVYTAYASWLAPVGNGIQLDGGLLPTLVGGEVNETNGNWAVTRGLVWGLQPVTNVGAVASTEIADGISMAVGVLNDPFAATVVDTDNEKAVTGQLAWSGEDLSAGFQFVWGSQGDGAGNGPDFNVGVYDVLLTYDGMEDISTWLNYTLISVDDGLGEGEVHGIAVASRMALSDDLGVAIRGEAVIFDPDGGGGTETYSVTLTSDYGLTDHLTAKGEVRVDIQSDDLLPDSRGRAREDVAALVLAQLLYEF